MYNIGFRAHDFGPFPTPEALKQTIDQVRPGAPVQLAPLKSFPEKRDAVFDPTFAAECRKHLKIAVLGSYFNPVHPDEAERQEGLRRFETFLALANEYGACAVGTETGSIDPDCNYHIDTSDAKTLDRFYATMEQMMESARKHDARVAIEPVATNHTISTLPRLEQMTKRFDSEHLAIILDPANIAPLAGIPEKDGTARAVPSKEALRSFLSDFTKIAGKRLLAIHVKNYTLDSRGAKICDLPSDTGAIDWRTAMEFIEERYPGIPFIIEGRLNDRGSFLDSLGR